MNWKSLRAVIFLSVLVFGLLPVFAFADSPGQFEVQYTNIAPAANFKPLLTWTYIPIGGTLDFNHGYSYGPYNPYAVSVTINSVSPSGLKVTVNIQVGGISKWTGDLGAGQSSPTITADGGTTYVRVMNNNQQTVTYAGTITLINN